jgi:uncharacterized protein (UPF0548 family)
MFSLLRPSAADIDRFVESSQSSPLSYDPVGLVNRSTPGFALDELTATIGRGERDFARAREALGTWRHFTLDWLNVVPAGAPVIVGTTVAVLIRHVGLWSLNGCRVVASVDEPGRFGFSYGTLTNHAERGEELFEVALDRESGDVTYRIRAASQPRDILAYLGYPLVRSLQARCRRESAAAMQRAIYF